MYTEQQRIAYLKTYARIEASMPPAMREQYSKQSVADQPRDEEGKWVRHVGGGSHGYHDSKGEPVIHLSHEGGNRYRALIAHPTNKRKHRTIEIEASSRKEAKAKALEHLKEASNPGAKATRKADRIESEAKVREADAAKWEGMASGEVAIPDYMMQLSERDRSYLLENLAKSARRNAAELRTKAESLRKEQYRKLAPAYVKKGLPIGAKRVKVDDGPSDPEFERKHPRGPDGEAEKLGKRAAEYRQDAEELAKRPDFHLDLDRHGTFSERGPAGDALAAAAAEADKSFDKLHSYWRREADPVEIGTYRGLALFRTPDNAFHLIGPSGQEYKTGDTLGSIEAVARKIADKARQAEEERKTILEDVGKLESKGESAWPKAARLAEVSKRLKELDAELRGKKEPEASKAPEQYQRRRLVNMFLAVERERYSFDKSKHPRGQPGNAGQFAEKEGGAVSDKDFKLVADHVSDALAKGKSKSRAHKDLKQAPINRGDLGAMFSAEWNRRVRKPDPVEAPTNAAPQETEDSDDDDEYSEEKHAVASAREGNWQPAIDLFRPSWLGENLDEFDRENSFGDGDPSDQQLVDEILRLADGSDLGLDSDDPRDSREAARLHVHDALDSLAVKSADEVREQMVNERYERWKGIERKKGEFEQAISKALDRGAKDRLEGGFDESAGGTLYAHYKASDGTYLKLRIGDHPQKPGGGFNQGTGERMGEADIEWVIDSPDDPVPSPQEIRAAVAAKLAEIKRDSR